MVKSEVIIIESDFAEALGLEREVGRVSTIGQSEGEERLNSLRIGVHEMTSDERNRIAQAPDVLMTIPVVAFSRSRHMEPDPDTLRPASDWAMSAIGAARSDPLSGAGVTVGILDTGICADWKSREEFAGLSIETQDFTGSDWIDTDGHGTHCAGSFFGRTVNGERIGVARGVTKAVVAKVVSDQKGADTQSILKGIQWATDRGARVINMSLGMDFPEYRRSLIVRHDFNEDHATSVAISQYMDAVTKFDEIAELIANAGVVLVSSSGNESRRENGDAGYVLAATPPASGRNILSVGAVGEGLDVASFSNNGVDIAAPGVAVASAALKAGEGLSRRSGTSTAAPLVAGIAAMWVEDLDRAGASTTENVKREILQTARPLPCAAVADVGAGLAKVPQI